MHESQKTTFVSRCFKVQLDNLLTEWFSGAVIASCTKTLTFDDFKGGQLTKCFLSCCFDKSCRLKPKEVELVEGGAGASEVLEHGAAEVAELTERT